MKIDWRELRRSFLDGCLDALVEGVFNILGELLANLF